MKRGILVAILAFFMSVQFSWGDIPKTMSYQGLLTNASGVPVANGNYSLTFKLYTTDLGGTALWSETQSSVAVVKGIFNVILGSGGSPLNLPFDQQYWLGVKIGAGAELTPRVKLTSSAYSLNAQSVANGAITNSKIADNAVTAGKVSSGQVVKSINGLKDTITLAQGANITITPSGQTLTIASTGGAGSGWGLTGNTGTTPGTNFLGTTDNKALELKVNNTRILRLEPNATSPNIIGGFSGNAVTGGVYGATIGGGGENSLVNCVTGHYGTVGGGVINEASGFSTVGGGSVNTASGGTSTIGGGYLNTASGTNSTVGGGYWNIASGEYATVGGGLFNDAMAKYATISGGGPSNPDDRGTYNRVTDDYGTIGGGGNNQAGDYAGTSSDRLYTTVGGGGSNTASGQYSTVPGGFLNQAKGDRSFAAGYRAVAEHTGSFVWADNSADADYKSIRSNQFRARAYGGTLFEDGLGLWVELNWTPIINTSTGAYLSNTGIWTNSSDVALKENFAPVDRIDVLRRLAELPISTWNGISRSTKAGPSSDRHIGPVAQDFYRAFGVGEDDKHISTVDADGVALVAIQGLYEIVQEKDAKIAQQEGQLAAQQKQINALEIRLAALEARIK